MHRLAGTVLAHRRLVLWLTLVIVAMAAALGFTAFGALQSGGQTDPAAESTVVEKSIEHDFGGRHDLVLVVRPVHGTVDAASVAAAGERLVAAVRRDPALQGVQAYWPGRTPGLAAPDHRAALVLAHGIGSDDQIDAAISRYHDFDPGLRINAGGRHGFSATAHKEIGRSLMFAELIAVPVILLLLLLVFGSVVSALLPLGVGTVAIFGTFAELAGLGRLVDVSTYAVNLTTALGLGLGIDYALLMVNRFRERLAAGDDVDHAVTHTMVTAGRTVAFSAATVAAALASLLVFPQYFLRSFAYAGVGVILIAAAAALVPLPAALAVLGTRLNRGRIRHAGLNSHRGSRWWRRQTQWVMAHPGRSLAAGLGLLAILAAPAIRVSFGTPDDRVLRSGTDARQAGDILRADFPRADSSALDLLVDGIHDPAASAALARDVAAVPGVRQVVTELGRYGADAGPAPAAELAAGRVRWWKVSTAFDPASNGAQAVVGALRRLDPPAGVTLRVGGDTAELVDVKHSVAIRSLIAAPIMVGTTFLLLFLLTGSVLQPLRALVSTLLSLLATLGIVTWAFQLGHLAGPLSFTPTATNLPMTVLLFCVVFGLSMDYEVFVIGRIRERLDLGDDPASAAVTGLARTGRLVSTAAALLAVTFAAFAVSSVSFLQMFGVGAAVAVLLDATVVRGLLLPSGLALLGRWAWFLPRWARPLHRRFGIAETSEPAPTPVSVGV